MANNTTYKGADKMLKFSSLVAFWKKPNADMASGKTKFEAMKPEPEPVVKLKPVSAKEKLNREFVEAGCEGYGKKVIELLEKGADINAKDEFGNTALHKATMNGRYHNAQVLVNSGADVNAKNNGGDTALVIAAKKGDKKIFQALSLNDADIYAEDNNGWTAHMWAVMKDHKDIAFLLYDKDVLLTEKANQVPKPPWGDGEQREIPIEVLLLLPGGFGLAMKITVHNISYDILQHLLQAKKWFNKKLKVPEKEEKHTEKWPDIT